MCIIETICSDIQQFANKFDSDSHFISINNTESIDLASFDLSSSNFVIR